MNGWREKTDGTTRTSGVASGPSRVPLQFAQQLLQASSQERYPCIMLSPAPCHILILCLQHSTKPRRRQSLVPSTCFKRFVCAAGEHRTAWMAPPFRIFSMRSVAACPCSEPKKLACNNIWLWQYIYIWFLFVSAQHCSCHFGIHVPHCSTRMHPWNPWHSMAFTGDALESSPSLALALPFTAAAASSKAFLAASAALFASRACGTAEQVTWRHLKSYEIQEKQ